jgi:hypothetical protein
MLPSSERWHYTEESGTMEQQILDPWSDKELARAGVELAEKERRLTVLENEKAAMAKEYNADIAVIRESISQLAAEIRRQKRAAKPDQDAEAFEEGVTETDPVEAGVLSLPPALEGEAPQVGNHLAASVPDDQAGADEEG